MSKQIEDSPNVKVYCQQCGLVFWEDELLKWGLELQKRYVPSWFTKARCHECKSNHTVMVEYPSQTVTLMLKQVYGGYY